jgi:formyltetrahydrofolate deformylase
MLARLMSSPPTAALLLSCPDQRGLVATVSNFIFEHNGNIVHADQHTDLEEGVFLQRVEWEIEGFDIPRDAMAASFAPIAERFGMQWSLHFSDVRPKVAIFVSQQGHCLYDLLARWRLGELEADISLIISNHATMAHVAESFSVPFHHLQIEAGDEAHSKATQEAEALALLDANDTELLILARYMQILSPDFVSRFPARIINIHHSFLPAFAGARPYHQAHERGVKVVGATAHYVTAELDAGPIIEQDVTRVSHRDAVDDLVQKGRDLEKVVLARAVRLHINNRVIVYGNKTVIFD